MDINSIPEIPLLDSNVLKRIFSYLDDGEDFTSCFKTCKRWKSILEDQDCWREIYFQKFLATSLPSSIIPSFSQIGWKKYFYLKLKQRKTFMLANVKDKRQSPLTLLGFKLGTQIGQIFDYKHSRQSSGIISSRLLGQNGLLEGRLVKGLFDRTIHYFSESEVGHISKAIFYRDEGDMILGGPSGTVYLKRLENDAKVIVRHLGYIIDLSLTSDHRKLFIVSRLEDRDRKVCVVDMKSFEVIEDYVILNSIFYKLHRDNFWYFKDNDESLADCDLYIDNRLIYQKLKGHIYKIEPLPDSSFSAAYTTKAVYIFKGNEIIKVLGRKTSSKKVLLGVGFDVCQEPLLIYGKGLSNSFVYTLNESSILVANGAMSIYDAMNGDLLYTKNIPKQQHLPDTSAEGSFPIKILHFEPSDLIVLLVSRSLYFFGADSQVFSSRAQHNQASSKQSPGSPGSSKRKMKQDLVGDIEDQIEEVEQDEREDQWLEIQRDRMNIEGMSEEEMIQYAMILSLDSNDQQ
jgi:hypothetical protein